MRANCPQITCLCLTHGRFERLRSAVESFVAQDTDAAVLLVYHFGEGTLRYLGPAWSRIRIVNERRAEPYAQTWHRALGFVETEFVRPWFDDDLVLPHAVRQGLENIGDAPAFKEQKHWWWERDKDRLTRCENNAEGSLTIRTAVAREEGLNVNNLGISIPGAKVLDLPPSWVFSWDDGGCHVSGLASIIVGNQEAASIAWRLRNTDHPRGRILTPGTELQGFLKRPELKGAHA